MRRIMTYLLLCCLCLTRAQNAFVDSLKKELNKPIPDTSRCIMLNALAEAEPDKELCLQYNRALLNLAESKLKISSLPKTEYRCYQKYLAGALNKAGVWAQMQGDVDAAVGYFEKSLQLQEASGDKKGVANTLHTLGGIYLEEKKYAMALNYADRSMQTSKALALPVFIRSAADLLIKVNEATNNYESVVENYELFIKMNDSIVNEEAKQEELKNLLKFEYEKKATEDSVKIAEEKKVSQVLLGQEQSQRNSLLLGLSLVALFVFFLVNRILVTNKQKKLIVAQKLLVESQKKVVDDKQKEILDSIKYAKRIQSALLTNEKYIERVLAKLRP